MVPSNRMISGLVAALFVIGAADSSFAEGGPGLPSGASLRPFFTPNCAYLDHSPIPAGCVCGIILGKIAAQCDGNANCVPTTSPVPVPKDPRVCNPKLKKPPQ